MISPRLYALVICEANNGPNDTEIFFFIVFFSVQMMGYEPIVIATTSCIDKLLVLRSSITWFITSVTFVYFCLTSILLSYSSVSLRVHCVTFYTAWSNND